MSSSLNLTQNFTIDQTEKGLTLTPYNKQYKYCLVFLHGYGMTVSKFFSVFLSAELLELLNDFKIYIPQAPRRIPQNKEDDEPATFSWFSYRDVNTLNEIVDEIQGYISHECKVLGNDPKKIFLGGFSQGGFVALYTSQILKESIGGVITVGAFRSRVCKYFPERKDDVPVTMIHGLADDLIQWDLVKVAFQDLLQKSYVKTFLIKEMKHDLNNAEARKIMYQFLRHQDINFKSSL